MNPKDLGLPNKFPTWRSIDARRTQYDAILQVACSDKRFQIVNAPTGIGKSTIYMGLAAMLGGRTLVLTMSKALESQLEVDWSPMGLVDVKGQANYPCLYFDDGRKTLPGCDEGPCHAGIICSLKERGCHYYDAVHQASQSELVVTNYPYWMTLNKYAEPGTLGKFDRIVLDEAHDAANSLADFVRVTIERASIEKLLEMMTPHEATVEEWVEWAGDALKRCRTRLESARNTVSFYHHGISVVRKLQELEGELLDLVLAGGWRRVDAPDPPAWVPGTATDWIVEETSKEVVFQPVWASGYSEQYLFAKIPRVVLVSATVTPKDAGFLGIAPEQFDYFQYPSPFKRSIRPVYVLPTAKVGRNMTTGEERLWVNRIDQIIEKEAVGRNVKGIIHARSYERAKLIFARSKHKDLLVIHDSRHTRETVARFKRMDAPAVLLSPAVSTGHDFPMDECAFQIIAKIPFIDSRPAVIKARHRADKRYLDYVALVELIQMAGRGVRSEQDFCRTYIIDDNFGWFWVRNRDLIPKWFGAALKRIRSLSEVA